MINLANLLAAVFSTVAYVYALSALMSYWAFLIPSKSLPSFLRRVVIYSMDTSETSASVITGMLFDIGLLLLFTVPHSTLARETTKKLMKLPERIERPLFVFQSAALLHTQMHYWKNFDSPIVWDVTHFVQKPIWILFGAGCLFMVTSSFALDHFHLFGLSQGMGFNINKSVGLAPKQQHNKLVARWHYALVAHPIMTGILTFLWATPIMTMPHLLLSSVNTVYILSAVILLEEPSLKKEIGHEYSDYLETVPRFCPRSMGRKKSTDISLCPHFQNKNKLVPPSQDAVNLESIEHSPNIYKAKAA